MTSVRTSNNKNHAGCFIPATRIHDILIQTAFSALVCNRTVLYVLQYLLLKMCVRLLISFQIIEFCVVIARDRREKVNNGVPD